jgi:hypothetical protein
MQKIIVPPLKSFLTPLCSGHRKVSGVDTLTDFRVCAALRAATGTAGFANPPDENIGR